MLITFLTITNSYVTDVRKSQK